MRRPAFVNYIATASASRSATDAAPPAILLVAIAVGAPAGIGPVLIAFLAGASAIGGPVVGAMFDRTPSPKRALAIAMITMAAAVTVLSLTMDAAPLPFLAIVTIIAGFAQPALSGAWSAQLPNIVEPNFLRTAYSVDAGTYSIAAIIGPPLAAAVLVFGPLFPLFVPAALLLIGLVFLVRVPLAGRASDAPQRSLLRDLGAGISALWRIGSLRRSTIIGTFAFGGQAAFIIASPLVSLHLTGELGFTGVILGVFAVGGVLVALYFAKKPVMRPDRTLAITATISGVALIGVGVFDQAWLVLLCALILGGMDAPLLASMFLIRTREAPLRLRAQIFTTSASLRYGAFALVSAILGALIWIGPLWIAVIGGVIHLIGVVIGILAGPRDSIRRSLSSRPRQP